MINLFWQPGLTLDGLEEQAIKQAFSFFKGNKSATARALDITVRTLESKLEKYEHDAKARVEQDARRQFESENFLRRQRGLEPLAEPFELRQKRIDEQLSRDVERKRERDNFRQRERHGTGAPHATASASPPRGNASEGTGKDAEESAPGSEMAERGVHLQSSQGTATKQSVSLPVRKEVQGMPPKHASGDSHSKRR